MIALLVNPDKPVGRTQIKDVQEARRHWDKALSFSMAAAMRRSKQPLLRLPRSTFMRFWSVQTRFSIQGGSDWSHWQRNIACQPFTSFGNMRWQAA